ncbi:hypothetical protein GQ55_9G427400 [Panicum hallii var. hallii]|uniref:F-box domain-containing protein n=1 Tax=Panicum hallii var. hallii TaxID=1504633 RepID=A0A2T7CAW5_9POAL|nr:hypothetical protein GQ55_9G427400 [Panicum hallii var. hallii]
MEQPLEKRNPAASLTDELLVEILRRVPIRSLCRFKCVSRSWRNLISDPVHRKKLPQTLPGFFYHNWNFERFPTKAHHFTNITGKGPPFIFPSFSFLPVPGGDVELLDSCNGLLLCRCFEPGPRDADGFRPFHYVVCNPATKKWVMLPDGCWASGEARIARLGFDPAVSSHFHVVVYVLDEVNGGDDVMPCDRARIVFLNGFMHVVTVAEGIVVVDMDGKTWRTIPVPSDGDSGFIDQAQAYRDGFYGIFPLFINVDDADAFKLSIWILEDHGTNEWTLKHAVRTQLLFRRKNLRFAWDYTMITVHPECNLIYFVHGRDNTLMAHECSEPYLPYDPLFLEALADEH